MCGITGFISDDFSIRESEILITKMTNSLEHRGPDTHGIWKNNDGNVFLGHRRLSILDLSSAGHQPMTSSTGRYSIIFNGEIYNHLEIRQEIENKNKNHFKWIGTSDTETLLASFETFDIEQTLQRCSGMFAFALWDSLNQTLTLARDRMGEKPLYYGFINNSFVFGSELKSLKNFPDFTYEISIDALHEYFRYSYVPSPLSIYQDIYKVEPGTFLQLNAIDLFKKISLKKRYWSLSSLIKMNQKNQFNSEEEALTNLESALSKSVKSQMISDVPLGVFLSGGIDSSLIASLAQDNSEDPIKTFTIGFNNSSYDESHFALNVAKHLKTTHSKITVTENDALDLIPKLASIYDEPFSDSSQIPTYFVCKSAKNHVSVALSGDGADELFGGYNRYISSKAIWEKVSWIPRFVRLGIGWLILHIPPIFLDQIGNFFIKLIHGSRIPLLGKKVHKLGFGILYSKNLFEFCKSFTFTWEKPSILIKGETRGDLEESKQSITEDPISNIMHIDSETYLPDDILCKVDRASMACSLETRAPYLDPEVIEVATRIPLDLKIYSGLGKQTLRGILDKYVPNELINRPKAGFAVPIGEWLRGPLKLWAEKLLSKELIINQGYLNYEIINKIWNKHQSGKYDFTEKLWSILIFQLWLEEHNK